MQYVPISTLLACLILGGTISAHADGLIDEAFGEGGLALTTVAKGSSIGGPVVQGDRKILFCGAVDVAPSGTRVLVQRLTAAGQPDPDFHFVAFDFGAGSASCSGIALQSDGKIVVAGPGFNVARLLTDGTLDLAGFGSGTGKTSAAFSAGAGVGSVRVAIDSQQRIVLAGTISTASHGDDFAIARLTTDGSPDLNFNLSGTVSYGFDAGGSYNDVATSLAVDSAGRIVVAGYADVFTSSHEYAALRLTEHGALDSKFGTGGRVSTFLGFGGADGDRALSMLIETNGTIILVGRSSIAGLTGDTGLSALRLHDDGSVDSTFANNGRFQPNLKLTDPTYAQGAAAIEQENSKIFFAGQVQDDAAGHSLAATLRVNADASSVEYVRDFDFGLTSPSSQAFFGLAMQGTQIIAAGEVYATDGSNTTVAVVVRLAIDLLFADGFE